ncbi:hypothetical protein CRV08_12515 [Halarcobacter ebronensis]|uniref:Uncharacterized protein n=1 Tax=Halarcobacter ebronensis TaxID=1462615 RepID=A0A4Q0Y8U0_9BACT|nr:hypothetical protein [Halarcobacter ebronensis]RXJ66646.1 hypothetical protein CRV08_12515 [Halarcobacter ebronensis]
MHKIIIENECGCFKRSDLENNLSISSKDEALSKAIEMKDRMNSEFCGKHNFQLQEDSNNFVIAFKAQKSTCCGGGHCG